MMLVHENLEFSIFQTASSNKIDAPHIEEVKVLVRYTQFCVR